MQLSEIVENLKAVVGINPTDNLDRDMKRVVDALGELGALPIEHLSVERARNQPSPADAVQKILLDDRRGTEAYAEVASVAAENILIPDAVGGTNPARIYIPAGRGPFPVILYFHGGGWVIADIDTYDATPRAMALRANAIVVSAHYRQAPEHPFPAAHQDANAAYKWLLENAEELGGYADNIAVMGESAGGNLAINVSVWARDNGLQMPVHQALIYPLAGTDMETPSYKETKHAQPLNKAVMKWFAEQIFADPKDKDSPLINLVEANLGWLPPTTIITAEVDPLRSEGETLAIRLMGQGTDVLHQNYLGVTHEFFGMAPVVAAARQAQTLVFERLCGSFARKMH
ncbi:alpha/beta hydrolase [Uliginosibacterium sp. H3]|uniref:Alpha/beta hydrolase n=1 Tax=Uliginosibacterium silvisoli TaxID=3114758 RepID=A0ABU6K7Z6_9RHOO|nr:alpha/beta hydrolase [Uliginosibacterium sp. H3]